MDPLDLRWGMDLMRGEICSPGSVPSMSSTATMDDSKSWNMFQSYWGVLVEM